MVPACLHTLLSLWYPTVRCPAKHSLKALTLLPASLLLLSICLRWWEPDCIAWRSDAQWWAQKHKIMGGLLREALLREKIFSLISSPPTQHIFFFSYIFPHSYVPSRFTDDSWLPDANETSHRGFNANQYSAKIHLKQGLRGKKWDLTYLKCNSVFCSRKCTYRLLKLL